MLKLGQKREPQRVVLMAANGKEPEAWVLLAPITLAMRRRAQSAMRRMLDGPTSFDELDDDTIWDLSETASRELIRLGVIEWGGIFDAEGKPVELTPDRDSRFRTANDPNRPTGTIDQLLDEDDLFEKLDNEYVVPDAKRRAKKRIVRLSHWHWGGGDAGERYCQLTCGHEGPEDGESDGRCEKCPYAENQLESEAGAQAWAALTGSSHQIRRAGMNGAAVSLDFASVMALADAFGADIALVAEVLPDVELAILAGANGDSDDMEGD